MKTETWRVVCDDGVREVVVECLRDFGASRQYRVEGVLLVARCARVAVGRWASRDDGETVPLAVREVVGPGEATGAERVAAERGRLTAACDSVRDRELCEADRDVHMGVVARPPQSRHYAAACAAIECADAIGATGGAS